MLPNKFIGEKFYIDFQVEVDGVNQNLDKYIELAVTLIGVKGKIIKQFQNNPLIDTIFRIDDYTMRFFVLESETEVLGPGIVTIQIEGKVNYPTAPSGYLKTIVSGDVFRLKNKIA